MITVAFKLAIIRKTPGLAKKGGDDREKKEKPSRLCQNAVEDNSNARSNGRKESWLKIGFILIL